MERRKVPYQLFVPPWVKKTASLVSEELAEDFSAVLALGVVQHVMLGPMFNDTPKFYNIVTTVDPGDTDARPADRSGLALDVDPERALVRSLLEGVERAYTAKFKFAHLEKRYATGTDVQPTLFCRWSTEQVAQYPQRSLHQWEKLKWYWVQAQNLASGELQWIPAQLVYWSYPYHKAGEPLIREINTNGTAVGLDEQAAQQSAVLELFERDAFLTWWHSGGPPRIDTDTIDDPVVRDVVDRSERYNFRIHLLNITCDTGVPAAACVLEDLSGSYPVLCCGAKAGPDHAWVALGAVLEAWGLYQGIRYSPERVSMPLQIPLPDNYDRMKMDMQTRVRLWGLPGMRPCMEPFLAGPLVPWDSFTAQGCPSLDHLVKNWNIWWWTHPAPELRRAGLVVGRAVSSALCPLYLVEGQAPVRHERLRALNPVPHPFP